MPDAPEPLVSIDCDVRDLDGFMLNVERLLSSELWALTRHNPEAFRGAVGLWARAWKQLPAASLPGDDAVIAAFADMPLPRFKKLRTLVMHGFVLCRDGRYYHRVLATEATKAFEKKTLYLKRRDADKKRLGEWRKKQRGNDDETHFTLPMSDVRNADVAEDTGQGQVNKKEGSGSSLRSEPAADAPPTNPIKDIFERGVKLFMAAGATEKQARGVIGKARREYSDVRVMAALSSCEDATVTDPIPYFSACLLRDSRPPTRLREGGVVPMHPGAGG